MSFKVWKNKERNRRKGRHQSRNLGCQALQGQQRGISVTHEVALVVTVMHRRHY